jgi:hypothetical protein
MLRSYGLLLFTDTYIAKIAKQLNKGQHVTAVRQGIRLVTWMMLGFMLLLVVVVSSVLLLRDAYVSHLRNRSF